jgi:hypothetical protein
VFWQERRMLLANSRRLCHCYLRSTLVLLMKVKHTSTVISARVLDLAHRHCMRCRLPSDWVHHQSHGSCSTGYARVVGAMLGIIFGAPSGYGSLGALEVPIAPTPPLLEPCQSPVFVDRGGLKMLPSLTRMWPLDMWCLRMTMLIRQVRWHQIMILSF